MIGGTDAVHNSLGDFIQDQHDCQAVIKTLPPNHIGCMYAMSVGSAVGIVQGHAIACGYDYLQEQKIDWL